MARNEEKQYSKLNRIILEKQREEEKLKNPRRPRLNELNTKEEIKMWLPSIKRDLDFNLKQSQVLCYPEIKIEEFKKEIEHLEREYKAFVRKLHSLGSKNDIVPWTDRPYNHRKRKLHKDDTMVMEDTNIEEESNLSPEESNSSVAKLERLSLPILQSKFEDQYSSEKQTKYSQDSDADSDTGGECNSRVDNAESYDKDTTHVVLATVNLSTQDAPLDFKRTPGSANSLGLDYDSSGSDDT